MADRTYVPYQPWACDRCGKGGEVPIPVRADVLTRAAILEEAHAKASPACADEWGGRFIRVGQVAGTLPE